MLCSRAEVLGKLSRLIMVKKGIFRRELNLLTNWWGTSNLKRSDFDKGIHHEIGFLNFGLSLPEGAQPQILVEAREFYCSFRRSPQRSHPLFWILHIFQKGYYIKCHWWLSIEKLSGSTGTRAPFLYSTNLIPQWQVWSCFVKRCEIPCNLCWCRLSLHLHYSISKNSSLLYWRYMQTVNKSLTVG